MNIISKKKQGVIAIICAIAMIVTSLTIYNPRETKAAATGSGNGKTYSVSGESQEGGLIGISCTDVKIENTVDGFMHFAWSGDCKLDVSTIKVTIADNEVSIYNSNQTDTFVRYSGFKDLAVGEYQIKISGTTSGDDAKEVYATATLKIETAQETTENVSKPVMKTNPKIEYTKFNDNDGYVIFVAGLDTIENAKTYRLYVDGKLWGEVRNGQNIKVSKFEAGTHLFQVTGVNGELESEKSEGYTITIPESSGETTNPSFEEGKELIVDPKIVNDKDITLEKHTAGQEASAQEHKASSIHIESGKWYVGQFDITSNVRKYFEIRVQDAADNHAVIPADTQFKTFLVEAGETVNVKVVFKADRTTDSAIFDICMGYVKEESEAGKVQITNNSLKGYSSEPKTTKYTVSVDGEKRTEQDGIEITAITAPSDGQGYYDVDKEVAYAPGKSIAVNSDMNLKSISLNVAMAKGASIRLAAQTGLRFQTVITSGNNKLEISDILNDDKTISTGTIITTSTILGENGVVNDKFVEDNSKIKLKITNSGWYENTVGTFCGSIVKIQESNYTTNFVGVGYVTIKYTNDKPKTIYASSNNIRSVATVAQNIINDKTTTEKYEGKTYYEYLQAKGLSAIVDEYAGVANKDNQ